MNIFQKIGIANKVIAAYKEVCNQSELRSEISGCVHIILTQINILSGLCPKVKEAWQAIKKAYINEQL